MLNLDQIRTRREKLNLSQDQAAQAAGIKGGRMKWNDIEKGRNDNPSIKTVVGMALALQCSVADLVIESFPRRKRSSGRRTEQPAGERDAAPGDNR